MILVNRKLFIFLLFIFISCQNNLKQYSIDGYTQGTTYVIKYNHTDRIVNKSVIDSLLLNIDLSMSSYIDSSLISLINQGHDAVLDSLITTVLTKSIEICHQTGGMFDVTIAPWVNYWGFGPDNRRNSNFKRNLIPSTVLGCDQIKIQNNRLIKSDIISIDLNGIAQGFTVDYLSQYLFENSIYDFMIEVGGEIRCSGGNLGSGWKIGIDKPTDKKRDFSFILNLKDMSLATSGSYRNYYYDSDSTKLSHTINPKTLKPVNNDLLSATILYSDCMSADAYATACMSFGLEGAKSFLNKNNIAGCLIYVDQADTLHYFSSNFSSFLH